MPTYMDIHKNVKAPAEEIAGAHLRDLAVESKYGVSYLRYWYNENVGNTFCLVEAPSADVATAVHREAHGLVADDIIEVDQAMVDAFLGAEKLTPSGTDSGDGGLRAIMVTDMVDSTALTQALGDARFFTLLQAHDAIIRGALESHGGNQVKHTGDGILASFPSVSRSVECAVAIQNAFATRNTSNVVHPLRVRIGLTAGEPVADHGDLFGAAVQMAARVCGYAQPDQILTSAVIRDLCLGKALKFMDSGEANLKGFPDPVRLYEVTWP